MDVIQRTLLPRFKDGRPTWHVHRIGYDGIDAPFRVGYPVHSHEVAGKTFGGAVGIVSTMPRKAFDCINPLRLVAAIITVSFVSRDPNIEEVFQTLFPHWTTGERRVRTNFVSCIEYVVPEGEKYAGCSFVRHIPVHPKYAEDHVQKGNVVRPTMLLAAVNCIKCILD
jgi:hypothetical protein